ncbi:DUF2220 domain-containing protein [Pseudomonas sp. TNT2022 ID1044]|uniref:Wadjet anti-phage system protein JetD domain-containing protein n=1 Tax=Pseudomonas sp. TNT2022 ID1044 TaxID=2942636 RepID=UPI00236167EE|nr:Wadjet anti-phage system protein JetD domain-containing protein [Pseudomonas sp. TNT2022 ID1044]MDD0996248.1 DUF2220 domain-containing protein [Pseudomonas sp. TNT2022 ID1044]
MSLAEDALLRLLTRGERARLSGNSRTIRESFTSPESPYWQQKLHDRDAMHAQMRRAATAGAIKLEWARQGGDDRPLDAAVLLDVDLLAAHLGQATNNASVAYAREQLRQWSSNARVEELLAHWAKLKQVRSLGPESAGDFADAMRVLDAMDASVEDQVVRQLSVQLFRKSKRIEALIKHLDVLTSEALSSRARHWSEVFGEIGLTKEPQPFLVAGTGHLILDESVQCSIVRPFIGVANSVIRGYSGTPEWLLTIENLTTFHQAAKALLPNRPGLVIYTAGMPSPTWGKAYANILMSLPHNTRILHWGDHDEGGFRVAARVAHFAATTGRHLEPWYMDASQWNEQGDAAQAEQHRSMIKSAIRAGWAELASTLKAIILEQEGLPIRLP